MALRGALAALILLAAPAWADEAHCAALRRLLAEAPQGFGGVAEGDLVFPGALRGARDGARFEVTLIEHEETRAPAPRLYRQLRRAIPECLPEAEARGETRIPARHAIAWGMPGAEVEIWLDRPPGTGHYALHIAVARTQAR